MSGVQFCHVSVYVLTDENNEYLTDFKLLSDFPFCHQQAALNILWLFKKPVIEPNCAPLFNCQLMSEHIDTFKRSFIDILSTTNLEFHFSLFHSLQFFYNRFYNVV